MAACAPTRTPTQLLVRVRSNLEAGDFAEVRVRVEWDGTTQRDERTLRGRDFSLPFSFGVLPRGGSKGATITVSLIGAGGPVLEARAHAWFAPGRAQLVDLYLTDWCLSHACGEAQSCGPCACIAVEAPPRSAAGVDVAEPLAQCERPDDAGGDDDPPGDDGGATPGGDAGPGLDGGADAGDDAGGLDAGDDAGGPDAGAHDAAVPDADTDDAGADDAGGTSCTLAGSACTAVVRASHPHMCALTYGGAMYCWGIANDDGELGYTGASSMEPYRIASSNVLDIGIGYRFTCALTGEGLWGQPEGTVVCWGKPMGVVGEEPVGSEALENAGQPGGPPPGARRFVGLPRITRLGAGAFVVCGLTEDDRLYCVGDYYAPTEAAPGLRFREFGDDNLLSVQRRDLTYSGNANEAFLSASDGKFTDLTSGHMFCGVREDGQLVCWGGNGKCGQLGRKPLNEVAFDGGDCRHELAPVPEFDTPTSVEAPVFVEGEPRPWTRVASFRYNACGVRDGELWCWGENEFGNLGVDRTTYLLWIPRRFGTAGDWADVTVGAFTTCALKTNAELWCGGNQYGTDLVRIELPPDEVP